MKIFYLPLTTANETGKLSHTQVRCEVQGPMIKVTGPGIWPFHCSTEDGLLAEIDRLRAPEVARGWTLESLGIVL